VAVEFLIRSLYEFLAHNTFFQLRYDTAKTVKEVLTVLETAAVVMMWAIVEYWRNCLTRLVSGPLSDNMRCWCNYERIYVISHCFCLTGLFNVKVTVLELYVGFGRFQWPRGQRRGIAAARLLGSSREHGCFS
jgi:hypothetical protein